MDQDKAKIGEIRLHSRALVRELDVVNGVFRDTGFTFSQCHVMFELALNGRLNLMELAERLLIDKSNASRTVKKLVQLGLIKSQKIAADQRQKVFSLTAKGERALKSTNALADRQVEMALNNLSPDQQDVVTEGLRLYSTALKRSRLQAMYSIRLIRKGDNAQIARVIRDAMTEFQAIGPGYSIGDAEVDDMHGNYQGNRACYYVIVRDRTVVGGGGIGPLSGGTKQTCELRKMFFLAEARGLGLGHRLLLLLLDEAKRRGYRQCYLETLDRMWGANQLYQRTGFQKLDKPMGKTGHCSCDRWYVKTL